jgi:hypothetical protein
MSVQHTNLLRRAVGGRINTTSSFSRHNFFRDQQVNMSDTYATLLNKKLVVPSQKTTYLAVDRSYFATVLAPALSSVHVDENWYLSRFPDVAEAIGRGDFASAADHYAKVGFYEHRMPYEIDVDDEWYLESYPDVAAAVEKGTFPSGRAHFYLLGYREGRFPHANFMLRAA